MSKAGSEAEAEAKAGGTQRVLSYSERKQLASLERKMSTLQGKLAKLKKSMHDTDPSDFAELIRLGEAELELKEQLGELEDQWLALSE